MTGWTARATTVTRPLIGAVTAHMVTAEWAARVVSPLHDVLTDAERRAILAENPDSYLHVTSDPLALPEPPGDAAAESVQARALRRLLDIGAYSPVPEPALFVYRLSDRGREHTGVIASVTVAGFGDGRVLGHEDVQPDRVAGLVRHYRQVPMRSELVALVHPADPMVAELTARVVAQPPLLAFTDSGGVAQSVWQAGTAEATALARQLGHQRHYVADGHHRVAAATRCWEQAGRPESGAVLCALYPQDQVVLHAFHRRVRGPVALPALLEGLARNFDVAPGNGPGDGPGHGPRVAPGAIGLYAAGSWRLLRLREPRPRPGVAGLDVTMLDEQVLRPLLGIDHGDPRLQFVPDLRDLGATTRECDADGGALFTLHAPGIADLVSVAERHEVMSTKTTYVQPKPRTGIFLS
jgi:uncharacterized protein (DUF1015 family)